MSAKIQRGRNFPTKGMRIMSPGDCLCLARVEQGENLGSISDAAHF